MPHPQDTNGQARARIIHNFTYHPPKGNQPDRYDQLRAGGRDLALLIEILVPDSRERSLALTNLEQAIMWANAAIARNEATPDAES